MSLLQRATLADGRVADVRTEGGTITEVGDLDPLDGEGTHDLEGWVLLPSAAEPHAHLDKALTADRVPNPAGDLLGAVEAYHAHWPSLTVDDIAERAHAAALICLAHGTTAIRTHVDLGEGVGLKGIEALVGVRRRLAGVLDIQVCALVSSPTIGPDGAPQRALLAEAIALGVDVVGGCPHLDPDPVECTRLCLALAAEAGLPLDLHTDETLDASMLALPELARQVLDAGFDRGTTASHCVSLGMQDEATQRSVAELLARACVAVVTLPQTNLFLQARDVRVAPPRGLTAVRALLDARVTLAAGGDNLQDPFNTMSRGDALETASLLVTAAHLTADEAYTAVTAGSRAAMGLPAVSIAPDSPADLLAVKAPTLRAAIASAPEDRLVWKAGTLVASTRTERSFFAGSTGLTPAPPAENGSR